MKAYRDGMIYTFEVEGKIFSLWATESADKEEAFLMVDGKITAVHVKITRGDGKSRWDCIIERAEAELDRCLRCGRAKKKWLADMEKTVSLFNDIRAGRNLGTPTPRLPGR